MRDAQDAMRQAGQSRAAEVLALLGDTDALDADARSARLGRRRRSWLRGGVASIALVAVAASFLTLRPEPPLGSIAAADGVVGEAAIMRLDERVGGYCDTSLAPAPYVPLAERGVTIASDEVRDLGIDIDARAVEMSWEDDYLVTEIDRGDVIKVTDDPYEGGTAVMTAITVSWDGQALYDVDAAAFMVAGDRLISAIYSWPVDLVALASGSWNFDTAVPFYDPATDRSSVTYASQATPECLGSLAAIDAWPYLAPDLPVSLHTFVQVRDEDGNPLVTNLDAAGLDGTIVTFPGYEAEGYTTSLSPAPVEEIEREAERVSNLTPQEARRSPAAEVRDAVAGQGVRLDEARSGVRLAGSCSADADVAAAEGTGTRVLVTESPGAAFPRELPLAAVVGSEWWNSVDEETGPGVDESYWSQEGRLLLLDPQTGELVAATVVQLDVLQDFATGYAGDVVGVGAMPGATCGDLPAAQAGTFHAVLVTDYNGQLVPDLVELDAQYLQTWTDLGTVTLTE